MDMVGEIRSVFVKDQRMIRKGDSLSPALEIKSKVKDANKKSATIRMNIINDNGLFDWPQVSLGVISTSYFSCAPW